MLLPEENNNKYSKLISYQGHYYASFDIQTLSNSKICLWDTKDVNLDYVHSISYPFQFIHTLYLHLSQKTKQGIHFLQRGLLVKTSIHTTFKLIKSNTLLLFLFMNACPLTIFQISMIDLLDLNSQHFFLSIWKFVWIFYVLHFCKPNKPIEKPCPCFWCLLPSI